ncbi:MAG TPA: nucleotidyl transferase AbiEii/AbiGii toxin family protein [Allosphingosinicella sp.]
MKQAFRDILGADPRDRRHVYSDTTETWPTSASFIEKDFVVSAALNILFGDVPDARKKLVFKGGTSLSKAHGLISRFSEDIDLVIVREELGFKDDSDPMRPSSILSDGKRLSNKARERLVDALKLEAANMSRRA